MDRQKGAKGRGREERAHFKTPKNPREKFPAGPEPFLLTKVAPGRGNSFTGSREKEKKG